MDYLIDLPTLEKSAASLESIKSKATTIQNNYNSSYLNSLSNTEIASVTKKLKTAIDRLAKGYSNSSTWFKKYNKEITTIEEQLSTFKVDGLTEPIEFKGKFEDLFGKRTMPAIQTNGDPEFNSRQITSTNGHLLEFTYNGNTFYVVNTKISIQDYENYVQSNKLYQKGGLLGGQCMVLSQYYAVDLLRGTYTSRNKMSNLEGAPATRIKEKSNSGDVNDIKEYLFSELNEGNPVVLQVTTQTPGNRHLVTVVGYKSGVTSASDLTPENLLVLDCYDGKIQTLSERNRNYYNQGRGYLAYGPTETFKSKEVNTESSS